METLFTAGEGRLTIWGRFLILALQFVPSLSMSPISTRIVQTTSVARALSKVPVVLSVSSQLALPNSRCLVPACSSCGAAFIINNMLDRQLDAQAKRTRDRPCYSKVRKG